MKTYRNKHFTKRDYECTNVVAIVAESVPKRLNPADWIEADASVLKGLTKLDIVYENSERYERYGYL